ncbi:hypothetical protein [Stutzerimonas nitrititolerans]|uniref:hypothetical protein n=1 Tax=Stutzerimonas nitrititolerans TaxID=2482751 RepID=UPI0028A1E909|nr:hypothetical protein [Stutzerimonas nitrititolerans]
MTDEELKQEQAALEAEEEEKAVIEQEAEDEELNEPLDQYTQECLEHDLDKLNP